MDTSSSRNASSQDYFQRAKLLEKLHLSTMLARLIRPVATNTLRSWPKPRNARSKDLDDPRLMRCSLTDIAERSRKSSNDVERARGHWSDVRNATVSYCPRLLHRQEAIRKVRSF